MAKKAEEKTKGKKGQMPPWLQKGKSTGKGKPPGAVKVAGPPSKNSKGAGTCPDCGKKLRSDGTCSCGYGE